MRVHALLCLLIWSVPVQCQKSETTTTPTTSADQDLSGQLVVGGYDGSDQLSSVEIFPPPSSDTCSIPDLPGPRNGHSLSLLAGGRLVVCGGSPSSKEKSCITWTRGSTSWAHLYNTSTARRWHVAWVPTSLPNSIVLLGGEDYAARTTAEIVPGGGTFALHHSGEGACGIPDEDTIVMTGGWPPHDYVTRYNVNGFVEELPQLPGDRVYHACAALPSTKAFIVAGGWNGSNYLSSVLTLLPGAQAWTPLASLPRSLSGARASIVGGKMRLTGGYDGSSDISEVLEYQPEPSNQWTTVGQLETERGAHAVLSIGSELLPCFEAESETTTPTTSPDHDLSGQLVVGGSTSRYLSSVEIFPLPSSDTCSIPDLPRPRVGHSISLLSGGRLVVCGGNPTPAEEKSCISWTRGSTSWTHLYTTSTARLSHVAWTPTSLPNSIVLLGGWGAAELTAEIVPGGGTFDLRHSGFGACGIPDEDTIVMTGGGDYPGHNHVTRYNVNGFVEELPQLPGNRLDHACAALPSTKAFIVAGGHDGSNQLSSVLTLLPGAQAWTPLASLPRSMDGARASIVGGKMRLTGGWDGSSYRSEVLEYQPDNQWTTVGQLETRRAAHAVLSIDSKALPCLQAGSETTTTPTTSANHDLSGGLLEVGVTIVELLLVVLG